MKSNALKSVELDLDWSAQTILPIEFRGQEVNLEARAYQGTEPSSQAFVLIHRDATAAMERIIASPLGILVYLPYHEGRGIGLVNKIRAYALQDQGYDTVDANVAVGAPIEAREYDLAAHILFDLGYPEIRLLTNNPAKVDALGVEGIEVAEQIPLIVKASPYNKRYLATKKERMAHKL